MKQQQGDGIRRTRLLMDEVNGHVLDLGRKLAEAEARATLAT
jgi:hypothetical protein